MARTTGPLFSMSAQGTVGDALTFQSWKGRNTTRQRPIPANPKTLPQQLAREGMKSLNLLWSVIDQTDRHTWAALAEQRQITAYNAFIGENLNRRAAGLWPISVPDPVETYPPQSLDDPSITVQGNTLLMQGSPTDNNGPLEMLHLGLSTESEADSELPSSVILTLQTPQNTSFYEFSPPLPPGTYWATISTTWPDGVRTYEISESGLVIP